MTTQQTNPDTMQAPVNGIDLDALGQMVEAVQADPRAALAAFRVSTAWTGRTRSESRVESCTLGGQTIERPFVVPADEPVELLGQASAPNPQELLMSALNACMLVGYVANASLMGIRLSRVEIVSEGTLDLRGFLGLDPSVNPGYDEIRYQVRIAGDGTPEQMRQVHETVQKTSPNYMNLSRPVRLTGQLVLS